MIKIGQVRKTKEQGIVFVITLVDETTVCSIDNKGKAYDSTLAHSLIEATSNVMAEYPTWQEAVSGKEFNEK